jgi:putative ABC transport system permease protein
MVGNIARRGSESVVQLVAFGMGLMVLLLLLVVRDNLLSEWRKPAGRRAQSISDQYRNGSNRGAVKFVVAGVKAPVLEVRLAARLQSINDPCRRNVRGRQRPRLPRSSQSHLVARSAGSNKIFRKMVERQRRRWCARLLNRYR